MKRFTPRKRSGNWSIDRTREQIDMIRKEVSEIQSIEITKIEAQIGVLLDRKKILHFKIANKQRYINQLQNQVGELRVQWRIETFGPQN